MRLSFILVLFVVIGCGDKKIVPSTGESPTDDSSSIQGCDFDKISESALLEAAELGYEKFEKEAFVGYQIKKKCPEITSKQFKKSWRKK